MAIWLKYVLIALIGYALGNISVGIIIARLYGIKDIRKVGSGNAGTTNVLRNLGWVPSVMTLAGDCLKALIAALIGQLLCGDVGAVVGGTFAMLGHDFPAAFKFRGGKGIASALGMILIVEPLVALALTIVVIVIAGTTGYVSLGSVTVCFLYPVGIAIAKAGDPCFGVHMAFAVFAALLSLFQHRKNIQRLMKGEENRLDFSKINKIRSKIQKN